MAKPITIWFPVIKGGSGTDIYTRRLSTALEKRGIKTRITWFPSFYQIAPFLLKNTKQPLETGIIHANSGNAFAFKRKGIPLVVTEHHCVFDPKYRPYKGLLQHLFHQSIMRLYETNSLHKATVATAVSHFTASSLLNTLAIRPHHVIYNWIDTNEFFPVQKTTVQRKYPFRLLFVGNLSRRKGADLLAPIMTKLGSEFELHFTSGLRGNNNIKISKNMMALGRLRNSELLEAYRQCDALLFPSRFEGFGYAALEAMACGKPVIASDNSALPEVVKDGVTGILCPTNDIEAFVVACRFLAENPEIGKKYGEAGRARVESLFSEEIIIPQYIALYEKLAMKQK